MPSGPSAAVRAAIGRQSALDLAESRDRTAGRLGEIRAAARRARDGVRVIADLEQRLKEAKEAQRRLLHEELPDLMHDSGMPRMTLAAEGNEPEYELRLKPYYRASIAAEWPPERREEAFRCLEREGAGDLVKTEITVLLGRGEREAAGRVRAALAGLGIDYTEDLSVPWNTLTKWLKETVERERRVPPLEPIGGSVGRVVEVKAVRPE